MPFLAGGLPPGGFPFPCWVCLRREWHERHERNRQAVEDIRRRWVLTQNGMDVSQVISDVFSATKVRRWFEDRPGRLFSGQLKPEERGTANEGPARILSWPKWRNRKCGASKTSCHLYLQSPLTDVVNKSFWRRMLINNAGGWVQFLSYSVTVVLYCIWQIFIFFVFIIIVVCDMNWNPNNERLASSYTVVLFKRNKRSNVVIGSSFYDILL